MKEVNYVAKIEVKVFIKIDFMEFFVHFLFGMFVFKFYKRKKKYKRRKLFMFFLGRERNNFIIFFGPLSTLKILFDFDDISIYFIK